jgi:hypothetical protein
MSAAARKRLSIRLLQIVRDPFGRVGFCYERGRELTVCLRCEHRFCSSLQKGWRNCVVGPSMSRPVCPKCFPVALKFWRTVRLYTALDSPGACALFIDDEHGNPARRPICV